MGWSTYREPLGGLSKTVFVGEALGYQEMLQGIPFVGPSGGMLDKLVSRAGLDLDSSYVTNIIRCRPPGNELVGKSYEEPAIAHCTRNYLLPDLVSLGGSAPIVAVGATSSRVLLNQPAKGFKLENWHGCPTWIAGLGRYVIPTFHPAFLLKGKQKMSQCVTFDILQAKEIAEGTYEVEDAQLWCDPPVEWFERYVDNHISRLEGGANLWLAVDVETPKKLGGDESDPAEDDSYQIIRTNFSNGIDHGVTVPFEGRYLPLIQRLLDAPGVQCYWNQRYDVPRLKHNGMSLGGTMIDFMWAWHMIQSDLPMGLGFVAPFFSRYGAWKHLSGDDPAKYAAIDAVQTLRCAIKIAEELKKNDQWEMFYRHAVVMDREVLEPAEEIGLLVDKEGLEEFKATLTSTKDDITTKIQDLVPSSIRKEKVWKRPPADMDGVVEVERTEPIQLCVACGALQVSVKHRCKDKSLTPAVTMGDAQVTRWVRAEPFNPGSRDDILAYMKSKGMKGGSAKGVSGPSTDAKTLEKLAKSSKDPFFSLVLNHREVGKVLGTYVNGTLERLGADGRIHPHFGHHPSTWRLSCRNPNLQNVVADKDGDNTIAAGFRNALIAVDGCLLVDADFSGIEAVQVGWYSDDKDYTYLAAEVSVHAFLTAILVGEKPDLSWPVESLREFLADIKHRRPTVYERAKHCVHGTNYGLTPWGMVANYPEHFTLSTAKWVQAQYFELCPKLEAWQKAIRLRAARTGYLGGKDHPFRYKHWFWNVSTYDRKTGERKLGEDAKRCVAFYPQSTAAGVLAETCLTLMNPKDENYVGDFYYGRTPIRALVHDSILAEVPEDKVDEYVRRIKAVMTTPIKRQPLSWDPGSYLTLNCEVKVGKSWAPRKMRRA